ncbi:MAG: helix-turn-helix transcriptional regulator, partial [Deltaproteobacteria bacterium]
ALFGVSPETVSRWENDRRDAEPAVWNAMADLVDDAIQGQTTTRDRMSARPGKGRRTVAVEFEPNRAGC